MSLRAKVFAALALLLAACATAQKAPDERYLKLSPESQALFAKYKQFMTDEQVESFYAANSELARKKVVDDLHVEERVAKYSKEIQDAIWTQVAVVGMDKTALFLAMGKPDALDREDEDPMAKQKPREIWRYRRGPSEDWYVTLVDDQVVDVKAPRDPKVR